MIRVAAVDDDRMLLDGLAAWSETAAGWRLTAAAAAPRSPNRNARS